MRQVYLVWGSPRSGKTTYVERHAKPGDLILDLDKIAEAISKDNPHDKSEPVLEMCLSIRDHMLDYIAKRKGTWQTAYVIGGYPRTPERQALIKRLGAIPIHIKEQKEVCLERAKGMPGYERAIWSWWSDHTEETHAPDTFLASPDLKQMRSIPPLSDAEVVKLKSLISDGLEKKFYDSARWKKCRKAVLDLDHGECVRCKEIYHHIRSAEYVHHVNELKDRPDLACSLLDDKGNRNLISVCGICHNQLHPDKAYKIRKSKEDNPLTEEWW